MRSVATCARQSLSLTSAADLSSTENTSSGEDGAVRYFHNRTYPIDIHCVAQSLLTLLEFQDLDPTNIGLVRSIYGWAMKHMWNEAGFFYYRVLRTVTIRTSYMRWSQAWMLFALATYLEGIVGERPVDRSKAPATALV